MPSVRLAVLSAVAVCAGFAAVPFDARPASAADLPATKLHLRSAAGSYLRDALDDPQAGIDLRAPVGSTTSVAAPTGTVSASGVYANGTLPGNVATPTFALPATLNGGVSGACLDIYLSKSAGSIETRIDLNLSLKPPGLDPPVNYQTLSVPYSPGTVVRVRGYVQSPTGVPFTARPGSAVYFTSIVYADQGVTLWYDSAAHPSSVTLNAAPASCPTTVTPTGTVGLPASDIPRYTSYEPPAGVGDQGAEPSVGVDWPSGDVMVQAGLETLRVDRLNSRDGTARWTNASPPLTSTVTQDPVLWVDHVTRRTFVSHLTAGCSNLALSDDTGRSWVETPAGCGPATGDDHQTIGSGNPVAGTPAPVGGYPTLTYYCSALHVQAGCATSTDGGVSFAPGRRMYDLTSCTALHGSVAVAPDGTAYVPNNNCGDRQAVVVSRDNGQTWTVRPVPFATTQVESDPAVAVDAAGQLYFAYAHRDPEGTKAVVAVSPDRGQTWTEIHDIGTVYGIRNVQFPTLVAGAAGRATVAFLGTPTGGNDQDPGFRGVWHVYAATTVNNGRTWDTVDLTPDDPVQRGCISLSGLTALDCRNLKDFIDITTDRAGHVVVAYADGCVGPCVINPAAPSTAARVSLVRQDRGVTLYPSAVPAQPAVVVADAVAGDRKVTVRWEPPAANGSAITGYTVYRGVNGAPRLPVATLPPGADRYVDTGVLPGVEYDYSVSATNAVGEGPHHIVSSATPFVVGAVDAARTTLTADPPQVVADGDTASTLTAVLRDSAGNPVEGHQVHVYRRYGPGSPTMGGIVTTDVEGVATFNVRSVTAGVVGFSLWDDTTGSPVDLTTTVEFVSDGVSAATSSVAAGARTPVADGTDAGTVTVVLRDSNGNSIRQQQVTLEQVAGAPVAAVSPATATTDATGTATFTVRTTTAGPATFSAATPDVVLDDQATVTFVAGPADPLTSSLVADVSALPADGTTTATFTVVLMDRDGNAASGRNVTLAKSSGPGSPSISPASATTDADGVARFTARSTTAGTVTFRATDTTDSVTVAYSASVMFQAGAVSASVSGVSASPATVPVDGVATSTVAVTLRDAHGNVLPGKSVSLAQASGPGTLALSPSSAVTDWSGQAFFSAGTTTAGAYTVRATDTTDDVVLTTVPTVTFVAGPVSQSTSGLTASPSTVAADGAAAATVVVTLRDSYGNAASGKAVALAKAAGPGTPSITPASATTNAAGQVSFTVKSTTAGVVTLRATDTTDNVVLAQTADVTFEVGAVSASVSGVSASPATVVADGAATTTVLVTLRDAAGNAVAGKSVSVTKATGPGTPVVSPSSAVTDAAGQASFTAATTSAGGYTFRATDTTDSIVLTSTAAVTFVPGAPSASMSSLSASPGTVTADGAAVSTVVATLRDAQGNLIGGKAVTLAKAAGPGSPVVAPASATTDGAGQATFTVKSVTAGLVTFRATETAGGVVVAQTADVVFQPGAVSAAASGVSASPSTVVADGTAATTVVVTLRDANGNVVSGKTVTVAKATGPGTLTVSPASATSNAAGQATFTAATTVAGTYTLRATDTSDALALTQTPTVTYVAGPASAAGSSVTASGNPPNDGTTAATVTVVLRDAQNNPATGRTVTLAKSAGTASPSITPASRVTDATGTATFSVTATTAGTATFRATSTTDNVVVTQTADVTFVPPPDVPAGFTATPGNAQVTLSWTPAAGGTAPTGYRVYQGGALVKTVAAPATSTTVTGLTDGTTYSFQVAAYHDTYRESAKTTAVSATPRPVPNAPTGLSATPGDGVVSLSWTAPAGTAPTEYRVWEDGVHVTTVTTTSTQRTGRTNGQAYTYEVQAHATNYGTSAKSAPAGATPVGPPGAPAGLAAAPGDGDVVLTWTAPAATAANPVTGQRVYVDGSATPVTTLSASTTTYRATGFTNFTGHTFVVASYNGTAETRTAAVSATPTAPPTALTVGTVGSDSVALSWTAPSGSPTGYRVYLDGVLRTTVSTTSTTLTGLAGATSYSIAVSAVNSATPAAESAKTAPVTVLTRPGTPAALTVTAGNRELGVGWTAPAGGAPAGYRVYLDGALAATVTTGTSTTLASLVNGQAYAVTVSAYNATGDSATAAANGTPTLPAPAYYSLSDTSTGTGADVKVTYAFEPVPNATGYRLYRDGVLVSSTFRTYLSTRRAMDDTARTFTTSYQYTVAAVDGSHVGQQAPVRTLVTRPDSVPATISVQYLCGSVANTYRLKFTWTAPAKGTWTGFRALNADGTLSGNVGSTIRTYTTGNQPEEPSGTGGFYWYGYLYTVNTPSTNQQSSGHWLQGQSTTNC